MTTFAPSRETGLRQTELFPISSAAVSPARTSALPARGRGLRGRVAGCGLSSEGSSKKQGRVGRSSKTRLPFVLADWMLFSGVSMRSALMRSGIVFQLVPLALLKDGTAYGSWPTPSANDGNGGKGIRVGVSATGFLPDGRKVQMDLSQAVKGVERGLWPAPTATLGTKGGLVTAAKGREGGTLIEAVSARMFPQLDTDGARSSTPSPDQVGGALNPDWVEALMGFPPGWTVLDGKPASRASRRASQTG